MAVLVYIYPKHCLKMIRENTCLHRVESISKDFITVNVNFSANVFNVCQCQISVTPQQPQTRNSSSMNMSTSLKKKFNKCSVADGKGTAL